MLAAATMIDKERSERAVVRVLAGEKQPPTSQNGQEWIALLSQLMLREGQDGAQRIEQLPQALEGDKQTTEGDDKHHVSAIRPSDGDLKIDRVVLEATSGQSPNLSSSGTSPAAVELLDEKQVDKQSMETFERNNHLNSANHIGTTGPPEAEFVPTPHLIPRAVYNVPSELSSAIIPVQRTNAKEGTPKQTRQIRPGTGPKREAATVGPDDNPKPKEIAVMEDPIAPTPRPVTPSVFPSVTSFPGQRPQSARKAPPILRTVLDKGGAKDLHGAILERPAAAIIGMDVPIFVPVKKPSILLDFASNDDDQDNMPILLPPPSMQETTVLSSMEGAGKFLRDILENKADHAGQVCPSYGDDEIGIVLGEKRETCAKKGGVQSRNEEIRKLREAVQTLCQTVNPLGKSIDHLQEDAEVMSREYQFWIKERDTYNVKLEEEKRITEETLQADAGRVLQLDEEIRQQNQRIHCLKTQILRNDERVMKSLRMVTSRNTR